MAKECKYSEIFLENPEEELMIRFGEVLRS